MVDAAIWPMWLGEVREMQPLFSVLQKNPLTGAAIAAFPAVAVLAMLALFQDRAARRDMGFLAAAFVFLIAVAVTLGAIRGLFLCDVARHAAGRWRGAAAVRGAEARDAVGAGRWSRCC